MSTRKKGDQLEQQVYDDISALIQNDEFYFNKQYCKVYQKKKYYSHVRRSDIEFDVSIEVFLPGATSYSMLCLVECKNYNHPVPVDDVEEFVQKISQVTGCNVKGILATATALQAGAKSVAEHFKLSHLRYFSQAGFKWELHRTPSGLLAISLPETEIARALITESYESRTFDYYAWSSRRHTNSLYALFEDLFADEDIADDSREQVVQSRPPNRVPFLSKAHLEGYAATLLAEAHYTHGKVLLGRLRRTLPDLQHIVVHRRIPKPDQPRYAHVLGAADFILRTINVFEQLPADRRRERFTVAHEFAHFLLDHGRYMHREMCEERDFESSQGDSISDIARLEFQANHLAACLLMPAEEFYFRFQRLARQHRLYRAGKARLYVDWQGVNLRLYTIVIAALTRDFDVTPRMAAIRLEGMGLLLDGRNSPETPMTL